VSSERCWSSRGHGGSDLSPNVQPQQWAGELGRDGDILRIRAFDTSAQVALQSKGPDDMADLGRDRVLFIPNVHDLD